MSVPARGRVASYSPVASFKRKGALGHDRRVVGVLLHILFGQDGHRLAEDAGELGPGPVGLHDGERVVEDLDAVFGVVRGVEGPAHRRRVRRGDEGVGHEHQAHASRGILIDLVALGQGVERAIAGSRAELVRLAERSAAGMQVERVAVTIGMRVGHGTEVRHGAGAGSSPTRHTAGYADGCRSQAAIVAW